MQEKPHPLTSGSGSPRAAGPVAGSNSGVPGWVLVAALGIKFLLGFAYGYILLRVYGGDDTWALHGHALRELEVLKHNPARFFLVDFTPALAIEPGKNWTDVLRIAIGNLEYALTVKTFSLLSLVVGTNYYVHSIFFNLLVFSGHLALFRALRRVFPDREWGIFLAVFGYLPALFWLSGYRGDGLLFLMLGLFIQQLINWAGSSRRDPEMAVNASESPKMARDSRWRYVLGTIASWLGVLVFRVEFALLLIPATVALILSLRYRCAGSADIAAGSHPAERDWQSDPRRTPGLPDARRKSLRPLGVFGAVYTVAFVLFLASAALDEGGGPGWMIQRQHQFLALEGTAYTMAPMDDWTDILIRLPSALLNTLFRPGIWEFRGFLQLAAAAETLLLLALLLSAGLRRSGDWRTQVLHPVFLFLLIFSLSTLVCTGLVVPFPGAIVRYKAIPAVLLLCCAALLIRMPRKNPGPYSRGN